MNARIVRLAEEHVPAFRAVLDSVAREERYLAMLQAPPLDDVQRFVAESVARERPQFIALLDDLCVGWCDIVEKPRDTLKHSGVLGAGVAVRVDNRRARHLYEKYGFEIEGLCRRHMRVRGTYYDSYLMAWLA